VVAQGLNQARFLDLLGRLVALGEKLQNSPDSGLIPEERLAAELVQKTLEPHVASGFLKVESFAADGHESRPSLVISVPGTGTGTVGLVGAHFDVVPAYRESEGWEHDPFVLRVDGQRLYGRGVTDCLGHVALLTDFLATLAENGQRPEKTVKVVLIANEEAAPRSEIGLDHVAARGALDDLAKGTLYWLDSADFGPTVGTAGLTAWELEVKGVGGHSGMPQNCVNALELAMSATRALSEWFEKTFPAHANEKRWGFLSCSSLKATKIRVDNDKITKIPGSASVEGDVRLTPFYDMADVIAGMNKLVGELDRVIRAGDRPSGFPRIRTESGQTGSLSVSFRDRAIEGIACDLASPGLAALERAIRAARPGEEVRRFSLTGSLPLVRDLQRRGFDVQITGFGRSLYYHAPNEQAELEHFHQGFGIVQKLVLG
jgi:acetylornithine deacetylase/succinyl-diaminopimelate desuccinylase-like protein